MRRRGPAPALLRPLLCVLVCALACLAGPWAGPAEAGPHLPAADSHLPTVDARLPPVDPAVPTPTAPSPGPPPRGTAPDGSTVGGDALGTRGTVVADGTPPLPDGLAAAGWLVADAGSGAVLAARDPHGRHPPASTLKALTLLALVPRLDPAAVVVGTREDEAVEGSRVGMVEGGQYPVGLLFRALVMQSGNDAAGALARAAGGTDVTLAAMDETARRLGAFDTVARTPSGLDAAGQSSSPYDLALIFRALLDDPVTAALLVEPIAQMPEVPGRGPGFQIQNENPLLRSYPGNLGGKTGFTDAARHTFVTAAERDGRRLVVSVMATEPVPLRASDQAALLLDWGFAVPAGTPGIGRLVTPADVPALTEPPPTPAPRSAAVAGRAGGSPGAAAGTPPAAAAAPDSGSALVPLAAAAAAVSIVAGGVVIGALAGRRRTRRGRAGGRAGGRADGAAAGSTGRDAGAAG
ncbi:serine hydrolase [Geodermatophilus sp. YIM 151500]|uniref:D-alanyl-D-alanine carboxypeptidase family protein n=1 Tax=Geodermatophilus sp. YIM 151500 TaxID=2984531 RepID=UPI0021E3C63E|nr:serine hydrolase [Geodermatophilus sp. YIM 151500]MCV2488496.1 serine hydrolase [Geodermatophilus sp. YIM 151500]